MLKNNMKTAFLSVLNLILISNLYAQVPSNPEDICPLLIGEKIPSSLVYNSSGEAEPLEMLIEKQKTVLIFFRGGWCPYCNAQLSGIQKIEPKIKALGYQIIAITPDKISDLLATSQQNKLAYQLYSDSKMNTQMAFGIAYKNEQTIKNYNGLLQRASGEEHGMLPVPAVFVLESSGKIKFEYINPDYTDRLDPILLLTVLEKLKK
jgi:peroxiredoxin